MMVYVPLILCDINALYLCGLPKTGNTCLIMGKTSDKFQLRDILQSTRPVLFNTVKVIKTKKKFEKLLQLSGT